MTQPNKSQHYDQFPGQLLRKQRRGGDNPTGLTTNIFRDFRFGIMRMVNTLNK